MSSQHITLGKSDSNKTLHLDAKALITTRMLITANSGGGKSYLMRKVFEQVGAFAQIIVLDMEGEFVTLREKLDLVIAGPTGEIPVDIRSAGLMVRRLMERELSAVIDMSEMRHHERRTFVQRFCETLVELPKSLWRPLFVGLDEAHQFAPEKGQGEASSTQAVIDLCTLGRKRGFCAILATQRISTLNKTAAGECNNKFIGRMTLDVDLKRAAFELGVSPAESLKMLRDRAAGEFYGFGPAVEAAGVTLFKVGEVVTTHPKAGQGQKLSPPKPSSAITAVVAELQDLPKQAEAEIRDMDAAKAKITELQRELKKTTKPPDEKEIDRAAASARRPLEQQVKRLRQGLEMAMKVIAQIEAKGFEKTGIAPEEIGKALDAAKDQIMKLIKTRLSKRVDEFERFKADVRKSLAALTKLLGEDIPVTVTLKHNEPFTVAAQSPARAYVASAATDREGRSGLTAVERDVIDAVASFPKGATKQRISIFSGRSITSSSFGAVFRKRESPPDDDLSLVERGLIQEDGDRYSITEAGAALAQATAGTSLEDWLGKLTGVESDVLRTIANAYPNRLTKEQISEESGRSITSSSFGAAFPALRDLGLIEGKGDWAITADLAEGRQ